ncbi:MAG: PKD domain-containing protein [Bacteroidota bacterium]
MKTIPHIVVILLLFTFSYTRICAQGSTSNKGTEFWTCWMMHVDGNTSAMSLYITGDTNASVKVEVADGSFSKTYQVVANQVTIVPATDFPISAYLDKENYYYKGIHITSDKNIVVYAHIYHQNRSGATLVLPVNAMGKDYYSINYTQTGNVNSTGYSTFCVIATEDNTTVEVTPTQLLTSGNVANKAFSLTLKKGQLYQALSTKDLTGTHIKSISTGTEPCKKIAVYSGSSFTTIACAANASSGDNLFQQVYPTATWGKNYITAPLAARNYDVFRIIYSDPTAKVTLNGTAITVSNNFYYEFSSQAPNIITSDKPIQVVQYANTQNTTIDCKTLTGNNATDVGDPEMIYLTPIEQGLDHVTLYSTNKENITKNFINVIIPSSAASSFILDGKPYTSFITVPNTINNTSYSYAQIPFGASAGTHTISAASPFNAIAYGFGNVESYGYSAGTDLKNLNEFIELKDPLTNTATSSGCVNITYKPQLSVPYTTTKITWDLKDGSTPTVTTPAAPDNTVTKNGQTLYVYNYPSTITYSTPNNYTIVATVFNATADECGSNEDIEFDYSISAIPDTKFTASVVNTCPGTEISFTDITATNDVNIKTWSWTFGDAANATTTNPNTATNQNPKHTYTVPGDYTVTLTVENQNGCSTTSAPQIIHIYKVPVAAFTASTPDCETRDITFDPKNSIANEGNLTAWLWDFGDGTTPVTKTVNLPFAHQFATAGNYKVSLTVTSSTGCVSNAIIQSVVINPLPKVDFTLPDVCLSDAFAQFTDKTTIADNSQAQFTYAWDFGDAGRSTSVNPNTSTLASPKHKYTQIGVYTVTLTVTSKSNCVVTKSQQFTVNGDTPNAAFSVNNLGNTYCSSGDVLFKDNSTVNFGNITKLVWYFDYNNNPTQTTVYTKDQFPSDHIYHHNYLLFNNPASKTYAVKMEAYSGGTCVSVTGITNITVYANPIVTVSAISSNNTICQEALPVQITAAVQNGVAGTGAFSGTGVSPTGLFDPAKAGPGTFTISYLFTTTATGCTYGTSQQVTVYPTPKANAGADLHVLQGGTVTINATASGAAPLSYKWTLTNGGKAIGLNHDDVLSPIASPNDDVTYMLTVTSANGCTASANVSIAVLKAPVVPNAFTPNNDGVNDKWEIKYLDTYPNCSVEVYNRYGEKLYSSVGYPIPWDGSFQGAVLPVGTYYYIINPKNGRKVITGSITIIR